MTKTGNTPKTHRVLICAMTLILFAKRVLTFEVLTLAVLSALPLVAVHAAQAQTEKVLYNFCSHLNCSDGNGPNAGLTSHGGNLYGTTQFGGLGYGTVFELSSNGSGGWNETVLYSFRGGTDPAQPYGSVTFDSIGHLYGTTVYGGAYGNGAVFELSLVQGRWTESVLYSFIGGNDGMHPEGVLIFDQAGNLYGTTGYTNTGSGTVFELSRSAVHWTKHTIYFFNDYDGNLLGLAIGATGNIFGTSGTTVYELMPNGHGGWNATVIHTFTGGPTDGNSPEGTPVLDSAGNVYGATFYGGTNYTGTIYKLSHSENGWNERILYSFGPSGSPNGSYPDAGIVFNTAGNIYGTTSFGGMGFGTVYELAAPTYTEERILWSFNGSDGAVPIGSLILDSSGNLYGTTNSGGSSNAGVVFEVTP